MEQKPQTLSKIKRKWIMGVVIIPVICIMVGVLVFYLTTYTEQVIVTQEVAASITTIEDPNLPSSVSIESGSKVDGERQVTYSVKYQRITGQRISREEINSTTLKEAGVFIQIKGTANIMTNDDFKATELYKFAEKMIKALNENDTESIYNSFYPVILEKAKIDKATFIQSNKDYPFYKTNFSGDIRMPIDNNRNYTDAELAKTMKEYLDPISLQIEGNSVIIFTFRTTEGDPVYIAYSANDKKFYYINYRTEFVRTIDVGEAINANGKSYKLGLKQVIELDRCQSLEIKGYCILTPITGISYINDKYDEVGVYENVVFKDGSNKTITERDVNVENIEKIELSATTFFGDDPVKHTITDIAKYYEVEPQIKIGE